MIVYNRSKAIFIDSKKYFFLGNKKQVHSNSGDYYKEIEIICDRESFYYCATMANEGLPEGFQIERSTNTKLTCVSFKPQIGVNTVKNLPKYIPTDCIYTESNCDIINNHDISCQTMIS
jgi:hypothetical protein